MNNMSKDEMSELVDEIARLLQTARDNGGRGGNYFNGYIDGMINGRQRFFQNDYGEQFQNYSHRPGMQRSHQRSKEAHKRRTEAKKQKFNAKFGKSAVTETVEEKLEKALKEIEEKQRLIKLLELEKQRDNLLARIAELASGTKKKVKKDGQEEAENDD